MNVLTGARLVGCLVLAATTSAFQAPKPVTVSRSNTVSLTAFQSNYDDNTEGLSSRRRNLEQMGWSLLSLGVPLVSSVEMAGAEDFAARDAQRKYVQESYDDFIKSKDGWLYREVKPGSGEAAKEGDRVVFDYSGYTIGYFGRPFQAKG